ncbi:MAG: glycosyltransferase family 2 protein [Candidatus Woesearchaeota archaeon]|nr:glycosyltransferase family 2 protein [Candidatus Woesearchaeota archaeon]
MKKRHFVSIIIPAKDEEDTIGQLLDDCNATIKGMPEKVEIIVVDNNCVDKTAAIAKKKGARVVFEKKAGKGHALVAGFAAAKGDVLAMMDADYSHRPEDLPAFIKKLDEGYGLVVGSRMTGGSDEYDVVRYIGNHGLTTAYRVLFWQFKTTDALNGFKVFTRDVFDTFTYHSSNFEIEIEILSNALKLGYTIGEVSSHERERAGGKMKSFAPVHGTKFLWKIIQESCKYQFGRLFRRSYT